MADFFEEEGFLVTGGVGGEVLACSSSDSEASCSSDDPSSSSEDDERAGSSSDRRFWAIVEKDAKEFSELGLEREKF